MERAVFNPKTISFMNNGGKNQKNPKVLIPSKFSFRKALEKLLKKPEVTTKTETTNPDVNSNTKVSDSDTKIVSTAQSGENNPPLQEMNDLIFEEPPQTLEQEKFSEQLSKIVNMVLDSLDFEKLCENDEHAGLPYGQGKFKNLFSRDKEELKKLFGIFKCLHFVLITLQLDPKDPQSYIIFRKLFKEKGVKAPWPILANNLEVPDKNIIPYTRSFLNSHVDSLNTHEELMELIKETRKNSYFSGAKDLLEESLDDFASTDWLRMTGVRSTELTYRDIKPYFEKPKPGSDAETVHYFYANIQAAWDIMNRPTIPLSEKNKLKDEFTPVVQDVIALIYSHLMTNFEFVKYMSGAVEIRQELDKIPTVAERQRKEEKLKSKFGGGNKGNSSQEASGDNVQTGGDQTTLTAVEIIEESNSLQIEQNSKNADVKVERIYDADAIKKRALKAGEDVSAEEKRKIIIQKLNFNRGNGLQAQA